MTAAEIDERIVALARAAERSARRLDVLDELLRRLATDVARIAGGPGDDSPAPGDGLPRVRAWLLCDEADRAQQDLRDLTEWLHRVYLRFPGASLPSCWMWHPTGIEELWWLRNAHADAYDPERGSWLRVGDWHDRQRPGVVRRLAAIAGCELSLHRFGAEQALAPLDVPMAVDVDELAAAWANGGRLHALPEPTAEQLDRAEEHDRRARRSSRR